MKIYPCLSSRRSCTLRHPTKRRAPVPQGPDVPKSINTTRACRRQDSRQCIGGASGNGRARRERRRVRGDGRARYGTTLHQGRRRCIASWGGELWELRSWDRGWRRWLAEGVVCREGVIRTIRNREVSIFTRGDDKRGGQGWGLTQTPSFAARATAGKPAAARPDTGVVGNIAAVVAAVLPPQPAAACIPPATLPHIVPVGHTGRMQ